MPEHDEDEALDGEIVTPSVEQHLATVPVAPGRASGLRSFFRHVIRYEADRKTINSYERMLDSAAGAARAWSNLRQALIEREHIEREWREVGNEIEHASQLRKKRRDIEVLADEREALIHQLEIARLKRELQRINDPDKEEEDEEVRRFLKIFGSNDALAQVVQKQIAELEQELEDPELSNSERHSIEEQIGLRKEYFETRGKQRTR